MLDHEDFPGPVTAHCDYLVVGSGPTGVLCALKLAESGRKVILVEAGPKLEPKDFFQDAGRSLATHFWDNGLRATVGNTFLPTLQPRALGGGSVFNSAICMRASENALDRWQNRYGIRRCTPDDLAPHYEEVEAFVGVGPGKPEAMGRRNELFREGAEALGWAVSPLPRMTPDCIGTGQCFTGCRVGGKASSDRVGVPELLALGGEVWTCIHVDRLIMRGNKAAGVEGVVVHKSTRERMSPVRIMANTTILAAGVMATPIICMNSGLDNQMIGANLRLHPSVFTAGRFEEEVIPWTGTSQGYHVTEHMGRGIKMEDLWATPSVFTVRFPPLGGQFKRYLAAYKNLATWASWVSGDDSVGRVVKAPGGMPIYRFDVGRGDVLKVQEATALLTEMYFAAGAKEVLAKVGPLPPVLRSIEDARRIREADVTEKDFAIGSNHVFGTMRMGGDPLTSATNWQGKVHGTESLYVCDTSLFPDTPEANPVLTGMALAWRLGKELPAG